MERGAAINIHWEGTIAIQVMKEVGHTAAKYRIRHKERFQMFPTYIFKLQNDYPEYPNYSTGSPQEKNKFKGRVGGRGLGGVCDHMA